MPQISSHLLKKSLMKTSFFVQCDQTAPPGFTNCVACLPTKYSPFQDLLLSVLKITATSR